MAFSTLFWASACISLWFATSNPALAAFSATKSPTFGVKEKQQRFAKPTHVSRLPRYNVDQDRRLSANADGIGASSSCCNRKSFVQSSIGVVGAMMLQLGRPPKAFAATRKTGATDGDLPDLPPNAVRSYLQYRIPLQISADFYLLEFQDQVGNIDDWGEVNQLFTTGSSRGGQGQPNRMERNFVNPMRILGLSMPPDTAEVLRESQFKFERAMQKINKATAGVRRDLPVETKASDVQLAQQGWEDGRVALNEFFETLNETTGLKNELRTIPAGPAGPSQIAAYGRSQRKYYDLMKKTKQCQNRGGPALSAAWGQLMVSGYLQDSCGIPDLDGYFFQ